jgi:hypothetical protein
MRDNKDSIRRGYNPNSPEVTRESAIVDVLVDSMAGSGFCVFATFGDAVLWFWAMCEDHWGTGGRYTWVTDELAPTELRDGRQRVRAMLARYIEGGYTRDMADELHDIVYDVLGGNWAQAGYEVGGINVLPVDLHEIVYKWWQWGDPDSSDEYFAEMEEAGTPVPPFDINNPDHFARLEAFLTGLTEY